MNLDGTNGFEHYRVLCHQEQPSGPANVALSLVSMMKARVAETDDAIAGLEKQKQRLQSCEKSTGVAFPDIVKQAFMMVALSVFMMVR